ncbi:uncharacterized protein nup214 isoform X2 [Mustelus asterias]
MGENQSPAPEREMKNFHFRQMKKIRIFQSPDELPKDRVNLLVTSNIYGLIFMGWKGGLKIINSQYVTIVDKNEGNINTIIEDAPIMSVFMKLPVHHIALSSDDLTLSVAMSSEEYGLVIAFFDVRTFLNKEKQQKRPFVYYKPETKGTVLDLKWNPAVSSILAVCQSDGSLTMLEVTDIIKQHASLPPTAGITSLCWSPKGKQLAAGRQDGTVVQYSPVLQEKKVIQAPPFYTPDNPVKVLDISWISTYVFGVVYVAADGSLESPPELVILSLAKKDEKREDRFFNFNDLCFGVTTERQHHYYLHYFESWDMLFASSAASIEVSIVARQADKTDWELWVLEDAARAEFPVTENSEDTMPVGIGIDVTSQQPVTIGPEKVYPPCPILMLLSTDGLLCPFYMLNSIPAMKAVTHAPQCPNIHGEREPRSAQVSIPAPSVLVPSHVATASPQDSAVVVHPRASFRPTVLPVILPTLPPFPKEPPKELPHPQVRLEVYESGSSSDNNGLQGLKFGLTHSSKFVRFLDLGTTSVSSDSESTAETSQQVHHGETHHREAHGTHAAITRSSLGSAAVLPVTKTCPTQSSATLELSVSDLEKQLQQYPTLDPVMVGIMEEIALFQKELDDLKARTARSNFEVGSAKEMSHLRYDAQSLHTFLLEVKEITETLHEEIGVLKTVMLEGFAAVEDATTHNERSIDKNYLQLLRRKPLDPKSEAQLKEIRHLHQYVKFAVQDVNDVLDMEWEQHQEKNKKHKHLVLPEREVLFNALASHHEIITQQDKKINELISSLQNLRIYNQTSKWCIPDDRCLESDQCWDTELEMLRNVLVKNTLDATPKVTPTTPGKLSPVKQSQLRNFLSKRQTPPVRSTAPANLTRSAFISPKCFGELDSMSQISTSLRLDQEGLQPEQQEGAPSFKHAPVSRLPSFPPAMITAQSTPYGKPPPAGAPTPSTVSSAVTEPEPKEAAPATSPQFLKDAGLPPSVTGPSAPTSDTEIGSQIKPGSMKGLPTMGATASGSSLLESSSLASSLAFPSSKAGVGKSDLLPVGSTGEQLHKISSYPGASTGFRFTSPSTSSLNALSTKGQGFPASGIDAVRNSFGPSSKAPFGLGAEVPLLCRGSKPIPSSASESTTTVDSVCPPSTSSTEMPPAGKPGATGAPPEPIPIPAAASKAEDQQPRPERQPSKPDTRTSRAPIYPPKAEAPPQIRPEAPPQIRPEAPPQIRPEAPPQIRPEALPQIRAEAPLQPRPESPPQPRPEAPPQPRPEAPPQPRPEAPPQPRPEAPPQPRPEAPPQPRPEAPPQPRAEAPPQPRPESPPQPRAPPQIRAEAPLQPRPESPPRPEAPPQPRPEATPQPKAPPQIRAEAPLQPRPESPPQPRPEAPPQPRPEAPPQPKAPPQIRTETPLQPRPESPPQPRPEAPPQPRPEAPPQPRPEAPPQPRPEAPPQPETGPLEGNARGVTIGSFSGLVVSQTDDASKLDRSPQDSFTFAPAPKTSVPQTPRESAPSTPQLSTPPTPKASAPPTPFGSTFPLGKSDAPGIIGAPKPTGGPFVSVSVTSTEISSSSSSLQSRAGRLDTLLMQEKPSSAEQIAAAIAAVSALQGTSLARSLTSSESSVADFTKLSTSEEDMPSFFSRMAEKPSVAAGAETSPPSAIGPVPGVVIISPESSISGASGSASGALPSTPLPSSDQSTSSVLGISQTSTSTPAASHAATPQPSQHPVTSAAQGFGLPVTSVSAPSLMEGKESIAPLHLESTSSAGALVKPSFGQLPDAGFGQQTPSSSFSFRQPTFGPTPSFAQTTSASAPMPSGGHFNGSTTTGHANAFPFGQSSASSGVMFGQSPAPAFGQNAGFPQSPHFGSSSTVTPAFGFGQPANFGSSPVSSVFSQPGSASNVFGQAASTGAVFGAPASTGGFFSGLGRKLSVDANARNPFGQMSFASTEAAGAQSLFGNSGAKTFGFGTATFGSDQKSSGSFSAGSSVASQGFGSFATPTKPPGGFGAAPVFGSPPGFGAAPTFGGSPAFGGATGFSGAMNPSGGKVFGEGTAAASAGGFGFGNTANAQTFASVANQHSTGAFGAGAQTPGFGGQTANFTGFGTTGGGFGSFGAPHQSGQSFASGWRG